MSKALRLLEEGARDELGIGGGDQEKEKAETSEVENAAVCDATRRAAHDESSVSGSESKEAQEEDEGVPRTVKVSSPTPP